jgi:hypothetical protein
VEVSDRDFISFRGNIKLDKSQVYQSLPTCMGYEQLREVKVTHVECKATIEPVNICELET